MRGAAVGDDDYGEDPTVQRLQAAVAGRMGLELPDFRCAAVTA